jgi:hypothetical protein
MAVDIKTKLSVFIVSENKTSQHYTFKCGLIMFRAFLAIIRYNSQQHTWKRIPDDCQKLPKHVAVDNRMYNVLKVMEGSCEHAE